MMMMTVNTSVFWDATPYSPVDIHRRFIATYLNLQNQGDEAAGSSKPSVNMYETIQRHVSEESNLR
jgi:hypothetical protein